MAGGVDAVARDFGGSRVKGLRFRLTRRPVLNRTLLIPLAVLGVVTTGCMKMDAGAEVNDDGSGTFHVTMSLDRMMSSFMFMGGDIDDVKESMDIPELGTELTDGMKVTKYDVVENDGRMEFDVEGEFSDPEALALAMTSTTEGTDDQAMFTEFSLVESGSNWEFRATPDPQFSSETDMGGDSTDDSGDSGSDGSAEEFGDFGSFMEGAMTPPEVNFSMTFPGGVDDSNATEVDGNTATWDLTDASLTEIEATAGPAGFPTLMVAAAVGGLALVALLAFFLIRRSRSVAPATAASIPGATYPGATYPGGTYPAGPPTWDPNPVPATAHDAWADETPAAIPAEPGAVESQSPRSAPVATAAPLPAAGWFPDPKGEAANRYWDGNAWTDHTSS